MPMTMTLSYKELGLLHAASGRSFLYYVHQGDTELCKEYMRLMEKLAVALTKEALKGK